MSQIMNPLKLNKLKPSKHSHMLFEKVQQQESNLHGIKDSKPLGDDDNCEGFHLSDNSFEKENDYNYYNQKDIQKMDQNLKNTNFKPDYEYYYFNYFNEKQENHQQTSKQVLKKDKNNSPNDLLEQNIEIQEEDDQIEQINDEFDKIYSKRVIKNNQVENMKAVNTGKSMLQETISEKNTQFQFLKIHQQEIQVKSKARQVQQTMNSKDRLSILQELSYADQMKECTFMPKTNHYGEKRSFGEFLELQDQFKYHVEEKKRVLKQHEEEQQMQQQKNVPTILDKSKQMIKNKKNNLIPVHSRLYNMNKKSQNLSKLMYDEDKENTFQPNIQNKSKSINRVEKVENLLYKDAQRRNDDKKKNELRRSSSNCKFLSANSQKMLVQKFNKEFKQILKELENIIKCDAQNRKQIDLSTLFEIFIRIGFIKYNPNIGVHNNQLNNQQEDGPSLEKEMKLIYQIWIILQGEANNFILIDNLKIFIMSILGIYSKELPILQDQQLIKQNKEGQEQNSLDDEQEFFPINQKKIKIRHFRSKSSFANPSYNNDLFCRQNCHNQILDQKAGLNHSFQNTNNDTNTTHNKQNQTKQQQNDQNIIDLGLFDDIGNWEINEEDQNFIHKYFEILYRNRLANQELKSNKQIQDFYSFQPQISEYSMMLANQHREKILQQTAGLLQQNKIKGNNIPSDGLINHSQFLILQKETQKLALEQKQQQKIDQEMKQCTFQPKINECENQKSQQNQNNNKLQKYHSQENLYQRTASQINQQQHQQQQQNQTKNLGKDQLKIQDLEKEMNQCTFKPNIRKSQKFFQKIQENQLTENEIFQKFDQNESVNKSVERMRNARKIRQSQMKMKERGYGISIDGNISNQFQQQNNQNISEIDYPKTTQNQNNQKKLKSKHSQNLSRIETNTKNLFTNMKQKLKMSEIQKQQQKQEQFKNPYQQNYVQEGIIHNHNINNFSKNKQNDSQTYKNVLNEIYQIKEQQQQFQQENEFDNCNSQNYMINNNYFSSNNNNQKYENTQQQQNIISINNQKFYQTPSHSSFCESSSAQIFQETPSDYQQQFRITQHSSNNNNIIQKSLNQTPSNLPTSHIPVNSPDNFNIQKNQQLQSQQEQMMQQPVNDNNNDNLNDETTPLLFVDVNLGNGRTERIVINEGDSAEELAQNFADKHCLDELTKNKFKELLESQISGILSRIEEEAQSEEEYSMNHSQQKDMFQIK